MPIFKVVSHERTDRFAIVASNLDEVLAKGTKKLKLPEGQYKILVDEDGTIIDEDDILLALADKPGDPLVLMLLGEGVSYRSQADQNSVNQGLPRGPQDVTSTSTSHQSLMAECSQPQTNFRDTLWDKIPADMMVKLKGGQRVSEDDRRELVTLLKFYMLNELKDTTRGTAYGICQTICEKYPESIQDRVDGMKLGRGYEVLAAHLYNAVGTMSRKRKAETKKQQIHVLGSNSDDEENDSVAAPPKLKKYDEYGCAEGKYNPQLSPDQTLEAMDSKRLKLIEYWKNDVDLKDEKVRTLLNETYTIQRRSILACSSIDDRFFSTWPYLQNAPALFRHAEELMGIIGVQEKWKAALGKYAEAVRRFVEAEEIMKNHTKKGKIPKTEMFVKKILQAAQGEATIVTRSDIPLISVIFPLIIHHFGETQDALYVIVDESLNKTEMLEKVQFPTPTLIVQGKSLCSENATYLVCLDNTSLIPVDGVYNGILLTFLVYFIFRIQYPDTLARTLELIQRYFLLINPAQGSKKSSKKRQCMSFDPRVVKFMEGVERYRG